jgi:hypothetical protein
MREITLIVVHCSATPQDRDIGAKEIREWHVRDNGWSDIGYHYVIRRNGIQEIGRPESEPGAHASGHNANSIGVCLVGGNDADNKALAECNYTRAQFRVLEALLNDLLSRFPNAAIMGHKDLPNVHKACPCFDVRAWWYGPDIVKELIA